MTTNLAEHVRGLYERHATKWDADRNSYKIVWNDKSWHDRLVKALPKDASVLDLGCGSGYPVARYLVENGLCVTGVDSSPTMISLCRNRLPEQEWIVSDMRSVEIDKRFNAILAWDSYFFLTHEDQRRMLLYLPLMLRRLLCCYSTPALPMANPSEVIRANHFITRA